MFQWSSLACVSVVNIYLALLCCVSVVNIYLALLCFSG